jgi:MFS family permease
VTAVRRRLSITLFAGAGLGTTGYIAAVTVSTLAVQDITGSALQSGLPSALATAGSAIGTNAMSWLVPRLGRRNGLMLGYLLSALGAALAVWATSERRLWVLMVAMFFTGFGQASGHLARYAAGDMYPLERRAGAISLIVWAGTIGSVAGPALLDVSARTASRMGLPDLAGGYLATAVFMTLAFAIYAVALRPDPASLVIDETPRLGGGPIRVREALTRPNVRLGLLALVIGQVVMVLIMTGTPIHIRNHGHGLDMVGLVIGGHTFGMFAFSPLTGRLANRFGRIPVIMAGQIVLLTAAVIAAITPVQATNVLVAALFLLGLGWNLGFVSSSALISEGLAPEVRARVQGLVDSATWASSALAAVSSGALLSVGGFQLLTMLGAALVLLPAWAVLRLRRLVAVRATV